MFQVFDKAKIGKVSFPVFRRALRNFGFEGDAAVLFQSLKPSASGKSSKKAQHRHELTLKDLLYLSTWECDGLTDSVDPEFEGGGRDDLSSAPKLKSGAVPSSSSSNVHGDGTSKRTARAQSKQSKPPSQNQKVVRKTSDAMAHCRCSEEYDAMVEAGRRQKRMADAYGRRRNEMLLDSIDRVQQKNAQICCDHLVQHKLPPMPINPSRDQVRPFPSHVVLDVFDVPRKLQHHAHSHSTGHLPALSPNGGNRCTERDHYQMQFLDGDVANRIMAKKAQRLQQVVSLPLL